MQEISTEQQNGALPAPASVDEEVAPPIRDDKAINGEDGYLFLANDSMDAMGQHTGKHLLNDQELHDWRLVMETRTAWLQTRGIEYLYMLSVSPHTMYPELLPEYPMAAVRPVEQLIAHLEEHDSPARIVYALPEILEAKKHRPVASKTSSHWNAVAGYAAYRKLIDEVAEKLPVYAVPEERVEYFDAERFGDLGFKVDPPRKSAITFADVAGQRAQLVSDNLILRRGRVVEWECPTAPDTTCLLIGDSFIYQMVPFLAESFGRLIFGHLLSMDYDLVREYSPDVVLHVMNERGLSEVMYDMPAKTTRQFAAEKSALGMVDPDSSRIWRASPTAPAVDKGC